MLRIEKAGAVLVLTIDRAEAHNALDPDTIVALHEAWLSYQSDSQLRCAILTGAGDRTFSAGADLGKTIPLVSGAKQPETDNERLIIEDPTVFQNAFLRNQQVDKPVIAAINGQAIAGGMEILYGTDIRVASEKARFGLQEVKLGITPAMGSTVQLPRQVPYAIAMDMLLSGELISAEKALEIGLINAVVPVDKVLEEAHRRAEIIAKNGPLAAAAIKRSVLAASGQDLSTALKSELEICMPVYDTEDAKEGPRAFMEKRLPEFKAR